MSATIKVINLPTHPFHHVLVEHLLMAGWRGVHRVPSKSRDVSEVVVGFRPDGIWHHFAIANRGDIITVTHGGEERIDQNIHAITAWLRKEEA